MEAILDIVISLLQEFAHRGSPVLRKDSPILWVFTWVWLLSIPLVVICGLLSWMSMPISGQSNIVFVEDIALLFELYFPLLLLVLFFSWGAFYLGHYRWAVGFMMLPIVYLLILFCLLIYPSLVRR
jgi:hypothetical protein